MRRVVSVWLPRWPIDRLRRRHPGAVPDDPFALVVSGEKGVRLAAVNGAASASGLRAGMALADARAVAPSLRTRTADAAADARDLRKLALWCTRYSPWTATDGADGLLLDVTGCAHLWGGEAGLLADLRRRLDALGLKSRLALAETAGAAWGLARYGAFPRPEDAVVAAGGLREALRPLPVEALRLAPEIVLLLQRLGLKTVGALYGLPRAALRRRFSSSELSAAVVLRLDQALGARDEPLSPLLPVPLYRSRAAFAEPVLDGAFIAAILDDLLADLCRVLARDLKGVRRLTLTAARVDGTTATLGIGASAPSRDARHLAYLFKEKLDALDPGFGIDALILSAESVDPLTEEQRALHDREVDGARLAELVDRLANTLGAENVEEIHGRESHIPERAEALRPAGAARSAWPDRLPAKPLRPFRLLARPEPIEVMAEVPEGPPLFFTWRRLARRVARAEGPERIAPEWWRNFQGADDPLRDYYRIEDVEGCRYWVFREGLYGEVSRDGRPRWYVHGLFA